MTAAVHAWRAATPRICFAAMRTILRGLAGIVVVAAVGFLWAHYFDLKKAAVPPAALNRQASVADFKVDFPSSWHVGPARPDPHVSLER